MGSQAGQCELVTSPQLCPSSSSGEEKPVATLAPTCSRVSGLTKHSIGSFPTPTIPLLLQGEFCNSLAMLVNRLKWKGYKSTWTHHGKTSAKPSSCLFHCFGHIRNAIPYGGGSNILGS